LVIAKQPKAASMLGYAPCSRAAVCGYVNGASLRGAQRQFQRIPWPTPPRLLPPTIPAKVAHQLKLDAGKQFTYFYVKVLQP